MSVNEKLVKVLECMDGKGTVFNAEHPLYIAMDLLLNDEQIDLLSYMEMRVWITAKELAAKSGYSLEDVERIVGQIRETGLILDHPREDGETLYEFLVVIPGMAENVILHKENLAKYPMEIANMFETVSMMPPEVVPMIPVGGAGLAMHVIPIEEAIPTGTKTVPHEEISFWLKKYDWISVQDCQCRTSKAIFGEWCGHSIKDRCIYVGDAARYIVTTGRGRRITYDEAIQILKDAEEEGLMHQISNLDGPEEIFTICNCCRCGCQSLKNSFKYNMQNVNRSNFVASVDAEKCAACGECVEYCPANALQLGQSLCMKEEPEEPEMVELPREEWGPKYWNLNFRKERTYVKETGTAPCKVECPAHISVQAYIRLAAQGKYKEALELIKKENPFPAICGRVCPHDCESVCTRGRLDEGVSIDEIKKFIAEKELEADNRFVPKKLHDYSHIHIAVVGSGPAGLSCAYYLAAGGYSVTVFEKEAKLGGMMTLGIPSFRLEKEVVEAEIDILRELGVKFVTNTEIGKDITTRYLRNHGYSAIYLAIGAQKGRMLGIEGEDAQNVISGVDFLRDINLGKECKLKGDVVVIGGGNVAIDVARTAVRVGDGTVSMFCLEQENEMPALPEELEEAREEQITINNGWGPKRIVTEHGKVVGVEFKRCTSVYKDGKFSPEYAEEDTRMVHADVVLLSVGQSIDWGNVLDHTDVKLGRGNVALCNPETYQTDDKDIFVGGDAYHGPKFAINAIATGRRAALYIAHYVTPHQDMETGVWSREFKALDKDNIVFGDYDSTPRQRITYDKTKANSFKDGRNLLTEEQIKKETNRCLKCGVTVVNENKCIGCGLCTTKCKFDAIHINKVYNGKFIRLEEAGTEFDPDFRLMLKGNEVYRFPGKGREE